MSKYRRRLMSYSRTSPVCDDSHYMYVIANSPLDNYRVLSFSGGDIEYTMDGGGTWHILPINTNLTLPYSAKVYFRARLVPNSSIGIGTFTMAGSGYFTVGGNLLSLIYKDRAKGIKSLANLPYTFYRLFYHCTGLGEVASDLLSEYTTLSNYCYKEMFYNTALVTSPNVLPAKTVLTQSYYCMFKDCWSLTSAPTINATSIGSYGCSSMFNGCDLLTTMPSIYATSIGDCGCYRMFYGCSSLVTAPKFVPTSITGSKAMREMFSGCSSLSNVNQLDLSKISSYYIESCYRMFSECSSLVTAPKLPSCNISSDRAVVGMFSDCSSLTYVKILAKKITATSCISGMLSGVSETGTFVHYPGVNWSSVIPSGWTVQTARS